MLGISITPLAGCPYMNGDGPLSSPNHPLPAALKHLDPGCRGDKALEVPDDVVAMIESDEFGNALQPGKLSIPADPDGKQYKLYRPAGAHGGEVHPRDSSRPPLPCPAPRPPCPVAPVVASTLLPLPPQTRPTHQLAAPRR